MQWIWYRSSLRLASWFLVIALSGPLLLVSGVTWAGTNISGLVNDFITGQPVTGAQVSVNRAGTVIVSGNTAPDGTFQLLVDVPVSSEPIGLGLVVTKAGFETQSRQVIVTAGRPNQLSYRFNLRRTETRNCTPNWTRTVVVGNVRPPVSAADNLELSQRISDVLQYILLTEAQKTQLPSAQLPMVLSCPEARPRSLMEQSYWVKALKTDVFLVGSSELLVSNKFRVDLQISAQHQELSLPTRASTPPLNLDRPKSASLGAAALEPIMLALLKAYHKEDHHIECVEFAAAALRVLGNKPSLLSELQACQARLPNAGLVKGGGQ